MAGDEALRTPEEQSESNVIGSSLHMPPDDVEAAMFYDAEVGQQTDPPIHIHPLDLQRQRREAALREYCRCYRRHLEVHLRGGWENTQNGVPMIWRNSPQNPSSLMSFMEAVVSNAKKISLTSLYILLFTCGTIIVHLAKELTSQFLLKLGNSSSATQAQLSLGETFQEFHTEIAYELAIMLVFMLALLLSCPRPLFVVFIVAISFMGLFLYIPDLVGKTNGNIVTCGFLRMSLLCFTTLMALVLSLIFVCLALFFAYLINRCARGSGRSTGGELEVGMEDLPVDVEEGMN